MVKQTHHFKNQLNERIGLDWDELNAKYDSEVYIAGSSTPHRIVRKKMQRYPNQDFIVFPEANLFAARGENGVLVTAMYLDGRWGYKDRPYDPKKHYGNK